MTQPRWASAPGDTIRRALDSRGMSVEDLADSLHVSDPQVRRLLSGEERITEGVAARLVEIVGSTQHFWLSREEQYRESLAWLDADNLVKNSPIKSMVAGGWIEAHETWVEQARALLAFYGVRTAAEWSSHWSARLTASHFRASAAYESSELSVAAWMRQVELEASDVKVASWSAGRLRSMIPELRSLSRSRDPEVFVPRLRDLLSTAGVALAIVRSPDQCRLSGAASVMPDGTRLVGLSARHLSDDHLWFTLFHELGHLLLHPQEEFLDGDDEVVTDSILETEANEFARHALVPGGIAALKSVKGGAPTMRQILAFASSRGVSPGIVVGQLQHDGVLGFDQHRRLIRRYKWEGFKLRT